MNNKKIVIAPDSFKESMSATKASQMIYEAIVEYDSHIQTHQVPLADGGEGTLETLIYAMNGNIVKYEVTGPLFNKIEAPIGYVEDLAIIECAKVCGLELLNENEKNPNHTTTYGLGELIQIAIHNKAKHLMICLGGSATNDGGIGMLSALGVRFYNSFNQDVTLTMAGLHDIVSIDTQNMISLKNIEIIGVCDVTNPLCGKNGASYIYGLQKGLPIQDLETIDQAMENYARIVDTQYQQDFRLMQGAGAAGGLGYALLAFMEAKLRPGFDIVSEVVHLEKWIKWCDYVIVGEGKIDKQTQYGKTPYGVLMIAKKYNKPVYAFAGKVEDKKELLELGFQNAYAITPTDIKLNVALKQGPDYLYQCVKRNMEEIVNEI